jgi:dGTP triphosphohydrolase
MLNERVSAAKKIASDLHQAEDAIDEAMIRIAQLAATLPTARRDTNMSAIVGQAAMSKVANALAAAGEVRQLLTDAHLALTVTQKEVGLGTRMFGAGVKPASAKLVDEGSNDQADAAVAALPIAQAV